MTSLARLARSDLSALIFSPKERWLESYSPGGPGFTWDVFGPRE